MSDHDTPEVGSGQTAGECRCRTIGGSRDPYEPHIPTMPEWEQADDCPVHPCAPASPVPVQRADAGEGLTEAERVGARRLITRDYDGWVYTEQDVERILAARDAEHADRLAAVEAERDEMSGWIEEHALVKTLARIAEWQTATGAEQPAMARAAMRAYAARAESAEARLADVEALADDNEAWAWTAPVGPGNASYANGYESGRRSLADDLRAALAKPTTTGDQP